MSIVLLFSGRTWNESQNGKYVRTFLRKPYLFLRLSLTFWLSRPRRSVAEYGAGEVFTRRAALDWEIIWTILISDRLLGGRDEYKRREEPRGWEPHRMPTEVFFTDSSPDLPESKGIKKMLVIIKCQRKSNAAQGAMWSTRWRISISRRR